MNLRIPDPSGLVEALHHLLDTAAEPPGREPIWEVIEWAGAWFMVRAGEFANPGMHVTREKAMKAGRRAT